MNLAERMVLLILLLQGTATVTLWSLNPTGTPSQAIFGVLLGVDLLGFALISYLYRSERAEAKLRRGWILAACSLLAVLLLAALVLA